MRNMDKQYEVAQPSKKSIRSLPNSIQSLVGFKRNLTPSWIESVRQIIKDLRSSNEVASSSIKCTPLEKIQPSVNNDGGTDDSVKKIQDELDSLTSILKQLTLHRRQALNDYLDLKGNIRVFCRIRPSPTDVNYAYYKPPLFNLDSSNVSLRVADNKSKQYRFDKVFHPHSTQEEVFSEIEPVINSALDGYNVCIFAYGQTGTGKTYTMEGQPDNPGVVPRGIKALLERAAESNYKFLFTFSMLEIYMGNLRDLLAPNSRKRRVQKAPCLSIQMSPEGGVEVENLVVIKVSDFQQVIRLYELGMRFRSTASTMVNSMSSRSHCLIRISLTCFNAHERRRETNKLWMVDLGGSERLLKTQASGRRLQEGKAINLSLSALGDVIAALQSKKSHVPYRNSKLTQVLCDSLGSDSKTLMLVHVSPNEEDLCETICSLGFATRVRSIHLENEESEGERAKRELSMAQMEQKVKQLERECEEVRRNIKKLKDRLKHVRGPMNPTNSSFDDSYQSIEEVQYPDGAISFQSSRNFSEASAGLPRFMRPTICSQHKIGLTHYNAFNTRKKPPIPSKKRPSSVYAESIISPSKGACFSDYNSECSISAVSLNWKESEENGTESSQAGSEYEIKQVIFPEQEKSPRTTLTSDDDECIKELAKVPAKDTRDKKNLGIDELLNLKVTEKTSTYTRRSKRVLAFAFDKENKGREICKADIQLCNQSINLEAPNEKSESNTMEKVSLYGTVEQFGESTEIDHPSKNMVVGKFYNGFDASSSELTEIKNHHKEDYGQATEENELIMECQKEYVEGTNKVEIGSESTKIQAQSPALQEMNSCKEETLNSCQSKEDAEKSCLLSDLPKVDQRETFNGAEVSITRFQEEEHDIGIFEFFMQILQILWVRALFGLGFQSLGLSDDFFDGLMF
ncbi:kinesin-like protein KIN-14B isoform X1 [Ananas comosus]|uniref:Kinesin-like protein KIN-14B isoform X1 n=1 Tax=Ananas comosus TaxID=4615 RepID=A0A6P5ET24_ANACO|nr:kinesin-like protein KIN-14B isoform X1 [Ananas comosus]